MYKIKRKSDGKVLVWKELNYGKMAEKEKQQLVSEVNILRDLKHPNIVRYYDRIIDKQKAKIYIVMEYCEGGDMGQLIKKCKRTKDYIAEDVIWKIFMQISLALNECHHRAEGKVLHRDLKPGNIFLDANTNVKLGDFGLSRVLSDESEYASTHVGTPYYMSPEQIKESKYNEKSDIWSAGCVLYEIAALRPPFEAANQLSLAMKIKTGRFERLPLRYSEELQKVLASMLRVNPEERPNIEDLLNVPQIALRIKESKLKDSYNGLKKKEEACGHQMKELESEEKKVKEELEKMETREKELSQLESSLLSKQKKCSFAGLSANTTDISYSEPLPTTKGLLLEKENKDPNQNNATNKVSVQARKFDKNMSQPYLLPEKMGSSKALRQFGHVLAGVEATKRLMTDKKGAKEDGAVKRYDE